MNEMETGTVGCEDGEQGRQRLPRAVGETVERLGYECVHVGMKGGPHGLSLEVLIDSLGGITVDDCETVSKSLNRMLDGANFPELEGRYYLEVSSPGVERPLFTLEQYGRFLGREARLRLQEPLEGRKSLTGTISAAEGEGVTLYVAEEERDIFVPFPQIKGGNLVFRMESQGPRKGGKRPSAKKKPREEEL